MLFLEVDNENLADKFIKFLHTAATPLIWSAIAIGVTLLIIFIISFLFNRFMRRQKSKRVITIAKLIRSIIRYAIGIVFIIVLLQIWGVNIIPIITGLGVLGLVFGLGAQSLISDLIAGIAIVFDNNYDVDEFVEIKGFFGRVIEIGLKSTRLQNWKGEVKIFSNGDIKEVVNFSRNPSVGVVEVEIAYQENLDAIIKIIDESLPSLKELYPQIIEGPNIMGVIGLGNAVTLRITVKTEPVQHFAVERGIRKHLKILFEEHKIKMPFKKTIIYDEKSAN